MTDESTTQVKKLVMQKAKTLSDQTNIVIAANSFLFLPFVSCFTGARALTGLLISVPMIICGVGIFLNAGLIWYIYTIKESIKSYNLAYEADKGLPRLSDVFTSLLDFFKKYAPIVLLFGWCLGLGFVILQLSLGMTL